MTSPELAALGDWLGARFDAVHGLEPIGAGAWSRAYGFADHEGRELVARVGRHVEDFHADALAAEVAADVVPVPRTLLVEEGVDGWVSVTTRCRGTFLEDLDGAGWRRAWPSVAAALRGLWSVDVTTLGPVAASRFGVGRGWADFLLAVDGDPEGGRSEGARAALARHEAAEATFRRGVGVLRELTTTAALASVDDHPRLVHCDLVNRNAMVDGDRLTGVFDWGCTFAGDPLYEVAWLDFWSPWHRGLADLDVLGAASDLVAVLGLDDGTTRLRTRAAALHIGLSHLTYCAVHHPHDVLEQVRRRTEDVLNAG